MLNMSLSKQERKIVRLANGASMSVRRRKVEHDDGPLVDKVELCRLDLV